MSGNGPPWDNIGIERGVMNSKRQQTSRQAIPHTPPGPTQQQTQLSPSPYGNSAARLLETTSIPSSTSTRQSTRTTISTYRQSPPSPIAHLPTSPPYTAGHQPTTFYSSSVYRISNAPPTTPDSDSTTDSDSDSDVFNPFSKTSQRRIQAMTDSQHRNQEHEQPIERHSTPLYSYPSSYEHTLLPSGLRLASPFGSPVPSPRAVAQFDRDELYAKQEHIQAVVEGGCMRGETEEDADNEESASSNGSLRKSLATYNPSTSQTTSNNKFRPECDGEDDHCQVFAKTTTFDPFAADDYAPSPRISVMPSIKLPAVAGIGKEKEAVLDQGDSARRMDEARGVEENEGDESGGDAYFCGSSRYRMVGGLGSDCDPIRLRECIETKVEINTLVGKYLEPHGIAIIVFHDHRAAGFVHQAIQCGALHLSEKQEEVYVKFLQPEEVHRILGNSIRPCLNSNEAKVCITFESSTSLIFPPIEQLKQTLSTFGDLQDFRTIGASDNAFLAIFCDSRIGPMAVNSLNKKFIGNAHLRLSLTCPLPDEDSTLPTPTELNDPHGQEVLDARDLARHLARVNASSGFVADVFQTQTWIGIPRSHVNESGEYLNRFRAPYHTPTKVRPSNLPTRSSPTLEPLEWGKATKFDSPLETPTKNKSSNTSRRLDDLFGVPITPESKRKTKTVEFDLRPKPSTLIEQLNAKFANLHSTFAEPAYDYVEGDYSDEEEEVKPFRDESSSPYNMKISSLPATPAKTLSTYSYSSLPRGGAIASRSTSSFPTPSPIRGPQSLHTTPQHVARIGRQARQVEIMKNVPKDMMLDMEALRTGRDSRTSVMIKDIPNKLSRKQLIDCIQEIVPGECDFVYLRFDFHNQCNVAYAFVNFTSVSALHRFAKARLGRRWGVFSSEKVLQMTYARVQGRDAFIQHFTNSPILNCEEKWRPVLLNERGEILPFPRAGRTTHARNRATHASASTGSSFFDSPGKYERR